MTPFGGDPVARGERHGSSQGFGSWLGAGCRVRWSHRLADSTLELTGNRTGTLRSTNHTIEGDGGSVGDLEDERSVEPSAQDESSGSAVEVNGARVGDAQHERGVEATMQDGAESSSHNHTTA